MHIPNILLSGFLTATIFWSSLLDCLPWLQIFVKLIIVCCLPLPPADKAVICIIWCSAADMTVDLRLASFSLCKDWFHQFFLLTIKICYFFNDVWWFVTAILIWLCLCLLRLVNLQLLCSLFLRYDFAWHDLNNFCPKLDDHTQICDFCFSSAATSHYSNLQKLFHIHININAKFKFELYFMIYHKRTKILAICNMLFTLKLFVNQILRK